MSERPDPASPPSSSSTRGALHERLERLVVRARATLWWERAWPVLWRGLAVGMAFLIVSWLGVWLDAPPVGRMIGLGVFTLALLAALAPLVRLRRPARTAALTRLDRDAGLKHGPARALEDTLAIGEGDAGTRALWDLHRRRAEAAIGSLRLAAPRPDMPRRDPRAWRAAGLVAVVTSAFFAGPEVGTRLASAFDWRAPEAAPTFRVDGWIDPPLYTRTPPLMIDLASTGEQRLRAPVKSTVVIRIAGKGDVTLTPGRGLAALPQPESTRADLREQRFTLTESADLTIRTGIAGGKRLHVEAIPDRAPEIALTAPPELNARGTFNLAYRMKDDYGVVSAEGLVEKGEGLVGRRSLVPAPGIALSLPSGAQGEEEGRSTVDLTNHPWAGAKVKLTLLARDEAEQEGRSETTDFTLPQRPFTKPLAKALVEQRRKLVLDPDDRRRVLTALDALLIEPEVYTKEWGVFMGLRAASARLRAARTDPDLIEVADFLWTMALQIEDGGLSDAERDLRAAQERLREALDRNASPEEIKKLTEELRQAMDKFLREFAERMQREQQQQQSQDQNSQQPNRMVTPQDLNNMLNQIEEMMRRGDVAEAQRLLDQLRNILENLQTARPSNRMSDPLAREMNRSMEELEALTRDQQQLRDETFRQGQDQRMRRGDRQQQGRQQPGQRQQQGQQQRQRGQQPGQEPGEDGQEGQEGQQGLSQRQQALRDRLRELQRRMQGMGMQNEQGLGDAEQAMRDAEGALGQGQDGPAVDAQGRALEGLQRGQQGMARQMQQMMGQGDGTEQAGDQPGDGMPQGRGQANNRDNDPLGRPTRSRDFSDGRVKVPTADESAVQRARRIMEELRRKLGEPTRPREELDYFDRLLRQR